MVEAKITQAQLVKLTGLSESTIHRVVTDKAYHTSDYTLQTIANVLHCSPYDLLRDEVIEEAIKEASGNAVAEVVIEAVAEAVTVVTDEVAPDAGPDRVAEFVPPLPVSTPPILDVSTYLDYIKETTSARVAELERSRSIWRRVSVALFVLLMLAMLYFIYELLNPHSGLTALMQEIYGGGV